MNKEEFITQLKQSISILDDQEQQYFVEEYTQHIDMKMSQGMSEDEAVREMGSVEELSKEILESYHVKINALESRKSVDYKRFFRKIKNQADKIYDKMAAGCKKAGSGIKKFLTVLKNICQKPFKREETGGFAKGAYMDGDILKDGNTPADIDALADTGALARADTGASAGTGMPAGAGGYAGRKQGGFFRGICRLIKGCFIGIGRIIKGCFEAAVWLAGKCFYLALWGLLILWNMFCVGMGLVGIFFTAVFVFFTGLFLVMLTQGYPAAGLTLCAFGASISMGSLVIGCFILTRWKITKEEKPEGGEVNA